MVSHRLDMGDWPYECNIDCLRTIRTQAVSVVSQQTIDYAKASIVLSFIYSNTTPVKFNRILTLSSRERQTIWERFVYWQRRNCVGTLLQLSASYALLSSHETQWACIVLGRNIRVLQTKKHKTNTIHSTFSLIKHKTYMQ